MAIRSYKPGGARGSQEPGHSILTSRHSLKLEDVEDRLKLRKQLRKKPRKKPNLHTRKITSSIKPLKRLNQLRDALDNQAKRMPSDSQYANELWKTSEDEDAKKIQW